MRARHLHGQRRLYLVLGRKTLDHRQRSINAKLANAASRELSSRLQLVQ
jgi:hypothetical protein